jgi:hypothetical protein
MCIFRYHHIKKIPDDFKDFELLILEDNLKPIGFTNIGSDLLNYELFNEIIKTVKDRVSVYKVN